MGRGRVPLDAKALCLGVLNQRSATGYEIKKHCEEGPFGQFFVAGFGSIYPALGALERAGLVSVELQPQERRPDRKVYSLTPRGRLALIDALGELPGGDRIRSEFLFILYFGDLLSARQIDALIEARLAALIARYEEFRGCDEQMLAPGEKFVKGYGEAVIKAQIDYLEANRHVLIGEALRAGDSGPAAPTSHRASS
jgi:DNA-binding PadR family transcriptional regulator